MDNGRVESGEIPQRKRSLLISLPMVSKAQSMILLFLSRIKVVTEFEAQQNSATGQCWGGGWGGRGRMEGAKLGGAGIKCCRSTFHHQRQMCAAAHEGPEIDTRLQFTVPSDCKNCCASIALARRNVFLAA